MAPYSKRILFALKSMVKRVDTQQCLITAGKRMGRRIIPNYLKPTYRHTILESTVVVGIRAVRNVSCLAVGTLKKKGLKQANTSMSHNSLFQPFYFMSMEVLASCKKIDFKMRPDLGCATLKASRKVDLDNPSVCLSVCLSCCRFSPRALTGVRVN